MPADFSLPPSAFTLLAQAGPKNVGTTTTILSCCVLGAFIVLWIVGRILKKNAPSYIDPAVLQSFNHRVHAWWLIWATLVAGVLLGRVATVGLFGLVSFWAMREIVTMTPTRRGDHRTLFWTFFLFTPLQYLLVGLGLDYYSLYSIMIPVYASLFINARIALSGDPKRFLERSAKIQAGLLICVYSLSYAPAILDLPLQTWDAVAGQLTLWTGVLGDNRSLLIYFVLVVHLSDIFQYSCDKLLGKTMVAPNINSSRTWEGFFCGTLCTAVVGTLLSGVTPFTLLGAFAMSIIIAVMGFAGNLTMSAIKRDRGVADFGTLVQGHAGILDRIDSLCFAAPVFYHVTRWMLYRM